MLFQSGPKRERIMEVLDFPDVDIDAGHDDASVDLIPKLNNAKSGRNRSGTMMEGPELPAF
jgi:hypothetical protein